MNRREALAAAASAIGAGVATSLPTFASNPIVPKWIENQLTQEYEGMLKPRIELVKQKRSIYALTQHEWFNVATTHQCLWDEHSRLSNLHHVDLAIQARQAEIRSKFGYRKGGGKAIDLLLHDGSHSVLSRNTPAFYSVAKYISKNPYGQTTLNPQLPAAGCGLVFTEWSIAMDITALITAEVPVVAMIFAILALVNSLLSAIFSSLPDGLCPIG